MNALTPSLSLALLAGCLTMISCSSNNKKKLPTKRRALRKRPTGSSRTARPPTSLPCGTRLA